jgi:hypothetical protein
MRFRRLLVFLALGLAPVAALAMTPLRVMPLEPPDGAVRGAHPVFLLGFSGIEDDRLREARFRIELSTDRFRSEAYVFDQREHRAGWVPGEPGRMLYRPRRPLADGDYVWRVSYWNGLRWVGGQDSFHLRIDTVPPADVPGLRLSFRRESGLVELAWEPVTLDREGETEHVERYHVYRYEEGPPFPVVRRHEIGSTPDLTLPESEPSSKGKALVFYRVTAEDRAGNEPLRRD